MIMVDGCGAVSLEPTHLVLCIFKLKYFFNPLGTPRPPFDDLIQRLVSLRDYDQVRQKFPVIVSIDIPSGWHVEEGDIDGEGIKPDMLVRF
jgi:isochorismate hydrolase